MTDQPFQYDATQSAVKLLTEALVLLDSVPHTRAAIMVSHALALIDIDATLMPIGVRVDDLT